MNDATGFQFMFLIKLFFILYLSWNMLIQAVVVVYFLGSNSYGMLFCFNMML